MAVRIGIRRDRGGVAGRGNRQGAAKPRGAIEAPRQLRNRRQHQKRLCLYRRADEPDGNCWRRRRQEYRKTSIRRSRQAEERHTSSIFVSLDGFAPRLFQCGNEKIITLSRVQSNAIRDIVVAYQTTHPAGLRLSAPCVSHLLVGLQSCAELIRTWFRTVIALGSLIARAGCTC